VAWRKAAYGEENDFASLSAAARIKPYFAETSATASRRRKLAALKSRSKDISWHQSMRRVGSEK